MRTHFYCEAIHDAAIRPFLEKQRRYVLIEKHINMLRRRKILMPLITMWIKLCISILFELSCKRAINSNCLQLNILSTSHYCSSILHCMFDILNLNSLHQSFYHSPFYIKELIFNVIFYVSLQQ